MDSKSREIQTVGNDCTTKIHGASVMGFTCIASSKTSLGLASILVIVLSLIRSVRVCGFSVFIMGLGSVTYPYIPISVYVMEQVIGARSVYWITQTTVSISRAPWKGSRYFHGV